MIRILIADDQALVRAGFRAILEGQDDFEVVGEAEDGRQAVARAEELDPDVVLMDVRMPDVDGIEATRRLMKATRSPKVLILTTFDLDEYVYEAMKAGAGGFLLKDAPREQLIAAVRMIHGGEALLAPTITRRLIEQYVSLPLPGRASPIFGDLTEQESKVLLLLAEGLSNAEIAERLVVSAATVKSHVAKILAKLGVRDRVQAVVLAYEAGLARPGQGPATD
jgi:DNA-binding NarL/FixJ family response regulator